MKIEDIRIGQEIWYILPYSRTINSFIVKGITEPDGSDWHICEECTASSKKYTYLRDCYASSGEALLALHKFCLDEIETLKHEREKFNQKINEFQKIADDCIERCR